MICIGMRSRISDTLFCRSALGQSSVMGDESIVLTFVTIKYLLSAMKWNAPLFGSIFR